jgi:hypothetical protein
MYTWQRRAPDFYSRTATARVTYDGQISISRGRFDVTASKFISIPNCTNLLSMLA